MSYSETLLKDGAGMLLRAARGDFNGIWIPEERCILQVTEISLGTTGPIITLSDSKYSFSNVTIGKSRMVQFAERVRLYDLIGTGYILGQ